MAEPGIFADAFLLPCGRQSRTITLTWNAHCVAICPRSHFMIVGVPREVVPGERRVALVPDLVAKLIQVKTEVVVQPGAGVEFTATTGTAWKSMRMSCTVASRAEESVA